MLQSSFPWKVDYREKRIVTFNNSHSYHVFIYTDFLVFSFTETRTDKPSILSYVKRSTMFSNHFYPFYSFNDVIETYEVIDTERDSLNSMVYEDVAIGMPGYAEEGQTLIYEDGTYTLSYEEAILPNFTLYIGDVDYFNVSIRRKDYDLKENLTKVNLIYLK